MLLCAVTLRGRIIADGATRDVLATYLASITTGNEWDVDVRTHKSRVSGAEPLIKRIRLYEADNRGGNTFYCGGVMIIELHIDSPSKPIYQPQIGIGFNDQLGQRLFTVGTYYSKDAPAEVAGATIIRCEIRELSLIPGQYSLTLAVGPPTNPTQDWLQHAVVFTVIEADYFGNGRYPLAGHGPLLVRSRWEVLTEKR